MRLQLLFLKRLAREPLSWYVLKSHTLDYLLALVGQLTLGMQVKPGSAPYILHILRDHAGMRCDQVAAHLCLLPKAYILHSLAVATCKAPSCGSCLVPVGCKT